MRKTSYLCEAVNAANKLFLTDGSTVCGKAWNRAFRLARDLNSTTLGCKHDSNIQELPHLESRTRDISACYVMEIVQVELPERFFVAVESDM